MSRFYVTSKSKLKKFK